MQYNENPRENFRAGDCVVRAISVVTGDSWEKIYVELCAEGYFMGDWGNNNAVWDAYLRRRGFKRYICPNDCPYCYSVADFANEHSKGSYILATGSHAVACVSGNWVDSWDSGSVVPIYYYTKIEYLKDLTEMLKDIKCVIGMMEDEEEGYSGNYYYDDDMSMTRGGRGGRSNRGNSYARRGNSYERGRSNRRGYTRMESRDDFMDRFEELMDEAPDEATRKKFERLMMEMK